MEKRWGSEIPESGEVIPFAIRIDHSKYNDFEYIYIQDIPSESLELEDDISVRLLADINGKVETIGGLNKENMEITEDEKIGWKTPENGFFIKIHTDINKFSIDENFKSELKQASNLAYDIVYSMEYNKDSLGDDTEGQISNKYKLYTVNNEVKIESGGKVIGDIDNPKGNDKLENENKHDGKDESKDRDTKEKHRSKKEEELEFEDEIVLEKKDIPLSRPEILNNKEDIVVKKVIKKDQYLFYQRQVKLD